MKIRERSLDLLPVGIAKVLREQCRRVGVDPDSLDYSSPDWYLRHSWTEDDESDFKRWLYKALSKDKDIRRDLLGPYRWPSPWTRRRAADEWCLMYGWRIRKEDDDAGKT